MPTTLVLLMSAQVLELGFSPYRFGPNDDQHVEAINPEQKSGGRIVKNPLQRNLIVIGLALFSFVTQPVFAQNKPVYLVSELTFKDANAYTAEYSPKIRKVYEKYGAVFIVGTANVQPLDQSHPQPNRVVIARFENMTQAQAYVRSPERAELIPLRDKTVTVNAYLVEGN